MEPDGPDAPHAISDAQLALHEAFAGEVATRLPRLASLSNGDATVLEDARRDAHSLASSAVIVDQPEIARLAQAVELDPLHGPVPDLVAALTAFHQRERGR
ncbi:MAG: hypothetical protein JWM40_598 [Frankiales bacterium]|nr:hypothetical protein [Frankiales bacterium]